MTLSSSIAKLGQNIQFVAFWAHAGAACFLVEHLSFGYPLIACAAIFVAAGIKEFYFDAKYEKDPPQTFLDNFEDWIGWAVGAVAGAFFA